MTSPADRPRTFARRLGLAVVAISGLVTSPSFGAEGREGLVEVDKADARLKGLWSAKGFKVKVVSSEGTIVDPVAMAFDDSGDLFVAEWRRGGPTFETWDTLNLPEGGTTRVRRTRKATADSIKRLRDRDGDGVYESAEVVLDGVEMPTAILPYKGGLLLSCVGRLERWTDEDGDGRFETRAILADGFPATGRQSLSGLTLGPDGWLYLTAGDGEARVIGSDGSRVDLSRTGGVYRCRPDGSRMRLLARGFRGPSRGLAFDAASQPFLLDDDPADGSKFQGVRVIRPLEEGDHGWRLDPGATGPLADFDRGAADGERPGKLGAIARLGRGSPSGLVIDPGSTLPEPLRGAFLYPDLHRRAIRALKVETKGGVQSLLGELTLIASDDERFRPLQLVVGPDGAIHVLDHREPGDGQASRLYRVTWEGDGATPATPARPGDWKRVVTAANEKLLPLLWGTDPSEAARAQREMVERGSASRPLLLGLARNPEAPTSARILGLQGSRTFWDDEVEAAMIGLLDDHQPDIRRLAAQSLAWEPGPAKPGLLSKLFTHLDDSDGRVVREVVLAIGRHAEPSPRKPSTLLVRRLLAQPGFDPAVKDAYLRSLERMGDAGVEELALAIRTRPGTDRESAVALFAGLRSADAAVQLMSLVKVPDLSGPERLALVRQFPDIPPEFPVSTQALADWVVGHPEAEPAVKVAALDACRLAGNPASDMVLALLDDDDEAVRLAATRLAVKTRPPGALARLAGRFKESVRSPAEKLAIVRFLGQAGPQAFATLDELQRDTKVPALRKTAIRSMAAIDRGRAMPALESALLGRDQDLRAEAIRILGEAPESAARLGKAYRSRALGRGDLPAVLVALRKYDSAEIREVRASIEDSAARETPAIDPAEVRERLNRGGDAWAGLGVFFRDSAARCSACHAVEGRGGTSGPSLTLGDQAPSVDRIIGAVLHHPAFRPGTEATRPRDRRAEIDPERDEDLALTSTSDASAVRPDRASLDLTPAEVVDLVAFLLNKPAQESLRHGPTRLVRVLAIGPFATGADKLRLPLDRVDPSKDVAGQDGFPTRWIGQEADDSGTLTLRGGFGTTSGRAYVAVRVRSDRDQSAALRFAFEGPARVYLDGARVAEVPGLDPTRPLPNRKTSTTGEPTTLPDLAHLPLKAGWNLLMIALDRDGTGEARLALEIASPSPVEWQLPRN